MNQFKTYNSTDFLNEESFLQWLLKTNQAAEVFWENFIAENPDKKAEIDEAIEIFNYFRFKNEKLSIAEIFEMWDSVKHRTAAPRKNRFISLLKYAAIFIFVFASGGLSYYFYSKDKDCNEFSMAETVPANFTDARIILADGKSVPLGSKESNIKYDASGQQVIIDNDTIRQQVSEKVNSTNHVIIPYGKSSNLTLSDGTKVWLNAGSQLMYPSVFDKKQREVLLIGEAFFEVVKDAHKPFVVRTEPADVVVLGTTFDVSAYPDDNIFHTVLVSGKVDVKIAEHGLLKGKKTNTLHPNEMFLHDRSSGVNYVNKVDVASYVSWKEGMLNCDRLDMNRVVRRLERYYNKRIHIKDPLIGTYKISGKLDLKSDISEVLDVLQAFVPIDWGKQQNGDYFIVKPN